VSSRASRSSANAACTSLSRRRSAPFSSVNCIPSRAARMRSSLTSRRSTASRCTDSGRCCACAPDVLHYLQRLLQLRRGGDAFARFDTAVTAKVLEIMGVMLHEEHKLAHTDALCVVALCSSAAERGEPLRTSTRVKAQYLCSDIIARSFDAHAESDGPMGEILRGQWDTEQLPFASIVKSEAPVPPAGDGVVISVPTTDDVVVTSILRGHVLGNAPDANALTGHVSGDPDTSAVVPRPTGKRLATDRALTADLILHSRTLQGVRDSEHQHDNFLAAHVLSSSRIRPVGAHGGSPGARRALPPDPAAPLRGSPVLCPWSSGSATARATAVRGTSRGR
jgi:hypothetical protein